MEAMGLPLAGASRAACATCSKDRADHPGRKGQAATLQLLGGPSQAFPCWATVAAGGLVEGPVDDIAGTLDLSPCSITRRLFRPHRERGQHDRRRTSTMAMWS